MVILEYCADHERFGRKIESFFLSNFKCLFFNIVYFYFSIFFSEISALDMYLGSDSGSLLMTTLWAVLRCSRPESGSSTSLVIGNETELLMNHT